MLWVVLATVIAVTPAIVGGILVHKRWVLWLQGDCRQKWPVVLIAAVSSAPLLFLFSQVSLPDLPVLVHLGITLLVTTLTVPGLLLYMWQVGPARSERRKNRE
jgi:hypothetical protein